MGDAAAAMEAAEAVVAKDSARWEAAARAVVARAAVGSAAAGQAGYAVGGGVTGSSVGRAGSVAALAGRAAEMVVVAAACSHSALAALRELLLP